MDDEEEVQLLFECFWGNLCGRPLSSDAWVNALLYGTILLFSSFAFVMPLYQRLPPGFYWGSEITYAILSLTAKLFLGIVILTNVLMSADRAEDVLGAGSLQQAR